MNVIITRTAIIDGQPRIESFGDVLDVQVNPLDGDNRTQAERNADNAIAAARLRRVERELRARIDHCELLLSEGAKRLDAATVLAELRATMAAPVEP